MIPYSPKRRILVSTTSTYSTFELLTVIYLLVKVVSVSVGLTDTDTDTKPEAEILTDIDTDNSIGCSLLNIA